MSTGSGSGSIVINNLQNVRTPFGVRLSGVYMRSFAYITLKDRLPVILTKVIDTMSCNKEKIVEKFGEDAKEEIKQIIGFISQLKNEIVTNKVLTPMPIVENEHNNDITVWNKYLQEKTDKEGAIPTWFNTEWLYCECYMYRTLAQKLLLMNALRTYDPFENQKKDALTNSIDSMKLVSKHLVDIIDKKQSISGSERKLNFFKLLKLNLWGNRCDLSLSAGRDSSQTGNPWELVEKLDNVLIDNTGIDFAWQLLDKQKSNDSNIVDIIFDNAGYELFTDLCLAIFLIKFEFAQKIRLYVKRYPWYVSDVTTRDFHWTLEYMKTSSDIELQKIANLCYEYLKNNIWTIEEENYWTGPYDFRQMKEKDKVLYAKLSDAKLLIFKGDLNYRKLLGDINWEYTTSFTKALGDFRPTHVISIRTVKCDLCVGLLPGKAESLFEKDENWMFTGEYGVIQATNESSCNCSTTVC